MAYRKLKAIGGLCIVAGIAFAARPAPAPISFSGLPTGERILADYKMSGCFASERFAFSFWRANGLQVEVHKFVREQDGKERRVRVGQAALSKGEERALDGLLRFYRSKPDGACTTVETVQFVHMKGGREVTKESYTDRSCSVNTSEVLHLGVLARRFNPPKR